MASQADSALPTTRIAGYYIVSHNPSESCQTGRGPPNDDSDATITLPIFVSHHNSDFEKSELERIARYIYFSPGMEPDKVTDLSGCASSAFRTYCSALNVGFEGGSVASFILRISFRGDFEKEELQTFGTCLGAVMSRVTWEDHGVFPTWFCHNENPAPDQFVGLIGEKDKTKIQQWVAETRNTIAEAFRGEPSPEPKHGSEPSSCFRLNYLIFERRSNEQDFGMMWNDS